MTNSEPTELDKELIEKSNAKKQEFITEMIKYRAIYMEDETNDYPLFLYIASIMNFVEYHNGGCLTEWGMKSLTLDISPYIRQLQTGDPKLEQKDFVRLLLNLLNSYATSVLTKGLFEFSREAPDKFFEANEFPSAIRILKPNTVITIKAGEPFVTLLPISLTELFPRIIFYFRHQLDTSFIK